VASVDIIGNCEPGLLVDPPIRGRSAQCPENSCPIRQLSSCASNGLRHVHRRTIPGCPCQHYLSGCRRNNRSHQRAAPYRSSGRQKSTAAAPLFTQSTTHAGWNVEALREFIETVRRHRRQFFVVRHRHRRRLDFVLELIRAYGNPQPDVLIKPAWVTEIILQPKFVRDAPWSHHNRHVLTPKVLRRVLEGLPGLRPREKNKSYKLPPTSTIAAEATPLVEESNPSCANGNSRVNAIFVVRPVSR